MENIVGHLVWWDLTQLSVKRDWFIDLISKSPLSGKSLVVASVDKTRAFLDTLKEVSEIIKQVKEYDDRTSLSYQLHPSIDLLSRKKNERTYKISWGARMGDGHTLCEARLIYSEEISMLLEVITPKSPICDTTCHIFDYIEESYKENLEAISENALEEFILHALNQWRAVNLSESRKLFFVSSKFKEEIVALANLFNQISNNFTCLPQTGCEEITQKISSAIFGTLRADIFAIENMLKEEDISKHRLEKAIRSCKKIKSDLQDYKSDLLQSTETSPLYMQIENVEKAGREKLMNKLVGD